MSSGNSTITCYDWSGLTYPGNVHCPDSDSCCSPADICLPSRLCLKSSDGVTLVRATCAEFPWNHDTCAQICLYGANQGVLPRALQCQDRSYCCDNDPNCCQESRGIFLNSVGLIVSTETSTASTTFTTSTSLSTSTTSSISTTSTTKSSSSSSSSSSLQSPATPTSSTTSFPVATTSSSSATGGLSSGAKIGLGVGVGLGAVVLVTLLAFFIYYRRKSKRLEMSIENTGLLMQRYQDAPYPPPPPQPPLTVSYHELAAKSPYLPPQELESMTRQ